MTDNRPYVKLEFTGDTLTQSQYASNPLGGTNIIIDYGDGTTVNYNGNFSHNYSASGDYTIRIYGVTNLNDYCFRDCSGLTSVVIPDSVTSLGTNCFWDCSGLTSVVIPDSVTSLGTGCFGHCSGLTSVRLNWTSTNDIITYAPDWFTNASSNLEFIIPQNTASLYETKSYPTSKLYELPPLTSPSLSIGGKTVKALSLLGKKVKSLTRVSDGTVLYQIPLWLEAEPNILQTEDTSDVYAHLCSGRGHIIHFFEKLTPVFRLTAEPPIIGVGEATDIYSTVKDSDGSRVVGEPVYFFTDKVLNALSVSSDKDVLSYADGEKAVLTAKLTGESVEGKSVVFKKGSTVLATETTDSSGEATYEYSSQGVGDVTITVECMNLQETYAIEDCLNYDSLTSDSGKWTIPTGVTSQYSDNGWKVSANAYKQIKLTDKLTAPCTVEFTLVDYNSDWNDSAAVIVFQYSNGETTPNQQVLSGGYRTNNYFSALGTNIGHAIVKGAKYKIEYGQSTMKVYENNTQLASTSNNVGLPTKFELHVGTGGNRWVKIKDVKVKPL